MFLVDRDALDVVDWHNLAIIMSSLDGMQVDVSGETLLEDVKNGDSELFVLLDPHEVVVGVIVTSFVYYDTEFAAMWVRGAATRGTRLTIATMRKLQAELEKIAMDAGCDGVRFIGGREWGRILTGFEETGRIYDKRLGEVH